MKLTHIVIVAMILTTAALVVKCAKANDVNPPHQELVS